MKIKILSVGKKPPQEIHSQIESYTKRLPANVAVDWIYFSHGNGDPNTSKQQESEMMLSKILPTENVIVLDEIGEQINNRDLSKLVFNSQKDVCFVIGGAYGISHKLKDRADTILSLSTLIFPHQLVRLILAEQLYRSYAISISHPYHHI